MVLLFQNSVNICKAFSFITTFGFILVLVLMPVHSTLDVPYRQLLSRYSGPVVPIQGANVMCGLLERHWEIG